MVPHSTSAQTDSSPPIRIETREVVVPVLVKQTIEGLDSEVLGLTARDFHVFEDGKQQEIEGVSVVHVPLGAVKDNVSLHAESSCTPRGIWIGPDVPQSEFPTVLRLNTWASVRMYLVSYVPPPSTVGSCHRVKVKVDHRPKPTVYAREEYCTTNNSLSDTLVGTKLGARIEGYLNSALDGEIPLSVQTGALFGTSEDNRIHVAVEFPWRMLRRQWHGDYLFTTIGLLLAVYDSKGVLLTRFSDAPCYFGSSKPWTFCGPGADAHVPPGINVICEPTAAPRLELEYESIPTGYENQIELAPGEYNLKVVITDGEKFGRAAVRLKVDSYDWEGLAVSGVVLCKRYHDPLPRPEQYSALVSKSREYMPAGDTRFKSKEPVFAYFQVREPLLTQTGGVKVHFQIRVAEARTGEIKTNSGLLSAESWIQLGSPVIPIAEQVTSLPPGAYRLEVQASDSAGHKTEWRTAAFTVE